VPAPIGRDHRHLYSAIDSPDISDFVDLFNPDAVLYAVIDGGSQPSSAPAGLHVRAQQSVHGSGRDRHLDADEVVHSEVVAGTTSHPIGRVHLPSR